MMSNTELDHSVQTAQKLALMLRWGIGAVAVALAIAGCGGGEAVSPTATAQTQLDQVAALTLAQQSVNARMAVPHAVALAAVSPASATATDNFESGMADWANWGNAQVVAGAGTSGSKAMQVGTGAGGAGLTVPGIVAGTAYRLTAQVKVSDPSETVYIGINMLSSSGDQVVGHSSPAVSSTGYTTVTVDLVAPANSATAVVWIWKNAGSGYAYLDDVSFGPATSAPPPPPPAPSGSNLLSNGSFESGMTAWANWGNANVVSGQANSGTSALSVGTAAGGAGQDVGGIVAGTVYRLAARAKVSDPSETVFVGVNLLNQAGTAVAQMALPVSSTTYSTVTFDITAPADAVKAVVYVWKNDGSGFGYLDDVGLGVASGSAPPPAPSGNLIANGGFETGLASWDNWGNTTTSTAAAAGSSAAQVGTAAGGFGQTVGGVVVGNTYRATAQVKVSSPGELGSFGLKFTNDAGTVLAQNYLTFNSTAYSTAQVDLKVPANATRALVYAWKNAASGFAYVDQVALAQVTSASPTPEQVGSVPASAPSVAQLANGGRIVAWNSTSGSLAQVFDANGVKVGAPVALDGSLSGVGALPDGSFIVATVTGAVVSGTAQVRLFVQKVSSSGQLLATGGTSDPNVNGGLADMLLSQDLADTISFNDTAIFGNADGSYVVETTAISHPKPMSWWQLMLVNVDATGNVIGAPVGLGESLEIYPPAATRLGNGNFLVVRGNSSPYPPPAVVWAVVTSTGQVVAQQSFAGAPGNSSSNPQVTTLADGSGLLTWQFANSTGTGWAAERIDGNGNVIATLVPPTRAGAVTGLAHGGWVQTWISGTQLMAQYFATSGQAVGDPFVVADNLAVSPNVRTYSVTATSDGFVAAYSVATAGGPRVDEIRFTAPALN